MILQIDELEFQWVGRFVDRQIIRFSPLGSFIQVDGKNVNTGGSSGAAKSTTFHALDYLLGFNHLPATIMQSRVIINPEENALWVRGKFTLGDDIIVITRSAGLIEVTMGGETYKKAQAEAQIDKLLGMPRELFRKILHKRQDEGGFFLKFGPTDMHNFLMDCIGLSEYKVKYKKVEDEFNHLEKSVAQFIIELTAAKAGLSATQDAILSLGLAPIQDMHREVILELKEKFDRSTAGFLEQKSRCETLVQEYVRNRPDTTNPQYDGTLRENFERRRKEIESQISKCHEKEKERQAQVRTGISELNLRRMRVISRIDQGQRTEADVAKIVAEIKSIRASACPTCAQEWKTESSLAAIESKTDQLIALRPIIADAIVAKLDLEIIELEMKNLEQEKAIQSDPMLPDLNAELSNIVAQILQEKKKAGELYDQQSAETKKKLDDFVTGQSALQKKLDAELDQARGQMDLDARVLDAAVQKLKAYETAKKGHENTLGILKGKEEIFTNRIKEKSFDLELTEKCRDMADESKKAIKSFVSRSLDKALQSISDKATQIIRCIPNTKNATIQLEGLKETGKGLIKEEINAVISTDGEEGVPLKSLSGGERSSTDLAVDLAVIDYIESKTSKGLNIFILDEPFKGLGTVEIEMALEVLKNSNINKKIIIVDHNPEIKQMVQDRLVVIREGLTSRVE